MVWPNGGNDLRGRRPALEHDLRVPRVHAIPAHIGVPGNQVASGHPSHHLVWTGDNAGECRPGALPVASRQPGIEYQGFVTGGKLRDLAEQAAAVRAPNGVEDLAQLAAPKVGLVGLVGYQVAGA